MKRIEKVGIKAYHWWTEIYAKTERNDKESISSILKELQSPLLQWHMCWGRELISPIQSLYSNRGSQQLLQFAWDSLDNHNVLKKYSRFIHKYHFFISWFYFWFLFNFIYVLIIFSPFSQLLPDLPYFLPHSTSYYFSFSLSKRKRNNWISNNKNKIKIKQIKNEQNRKSIWWKNTRRRQKTPPNNMEFILCWLTSGHRACPGVR